MDTNSLFIDSIKQHGLGAIDPLDNMKAKDLMHDFFSLADHGSITKGVSQCTRTSLF